MSLSVFTNATDSSLDGRSIASDRNNTPTHKRAQQSAEREAPAETPKKEGWLSRFFGGGKSKSKTPKASKFQYAGSTRGVDSSSDVTTHRFIDSRYLDQVFKGNLKGQGKNIIETAIRYGFDPVFFAAIMAHETGWGTSKAVRLYKNPGGMMTGGKQAKQYKKFDTIEEGIEKMAANLKAGYLDQGRKTIARIASKYAPIGAANDPRRRNRKWPGGVSSIMNRLIAGSVNMGNQKNTGNKG